MGQLKINIYKGKRGGRRPGSGRKGSTQKELRTELVRKCKIATPFM